MLSKNIRVYVEILPSFAVEGGNDILQHSVYKLDYRISIFTFNACEEFGEGTFRDHARPERMARNFGPQ